MTNNSKENCFNDVSISLARTANWRRQPILLKKSKI